MKKNLFLKKEDYKFEDQNDILFIIDLKIEELANLKIQVNDYLNNTKEDVNWVNYENVLSPVFGNLFKEIVINNFWFKDEKFTEDFFEILYLIENNNFFIVIDLDPTIFIEKDQKEIVLFKISMIYNHVYNILNKLVYINVSNKDQYAKNIIIANLLFILEKVENKNKNLEKIIEKYTHSSGVNYVLKRLNSHISSAIDNEEDTFEIRISLVGIVESMRKEIQEIKLSKKYYNKTDNCFAQYFNRKKSYKNLKSKSL